MADKHPYVTSQSYLTDLVAQLRKRFPSTVNADYLKQLNIAPNNEGVVINTVRFLGFIDDTNSRTELARHVFTLHEDAEFSKAFADVVRTAYARLFDLHGEDAWQLEPSRLIAFFRQADQASERGGTDRAKTFQTLAGIAGYASKSEITQAKKGSQPTLRIPTQGRSRNAVSAPAGTADSKVAMPKTPVAESNFGLTVRIEINLPISDDQAVYDRIFKSIRENLLNV